MTKQVARAGDGGHGALPLPARLPARRGDTDRWPADEYPGVASGVRPTVPGVCPNRARVYCAFPWVGNRVVFSHVHGLAIFDLHKSEKDGVEKAPAVPYIRASNLKATPM